MFKSVITGIRFWVVAFAVAIWHTLRNRNWHRIMIDFEVGEELVEVDGEMIPRPIRKQLIAKRSLERYDIYWQDIGAFLGRGK